MQALSPGEDPGRGDGVSGSFLLEKAKTMMYWYKNTETYHFLGLVLFQYFKIKPSISYMGLYRPHPHSIYKHWLENSCVINGGNIKLNILWPQEGLGCAPDPCFRNPFLYSNPPSRKSWGHPRLMHTHTRARAHPRTHTHTHTPLLEITVGQWPFSDPFQHWSAKIYFDWPTFPYIFSRATV